MNRRLESLSTIVAKVVADACMFAAALITAHYLRFEGTIPPQFTQELVTVLPWAVALKTLVFALLGSYATLWRYSSLRDFLKLGQAVLLSTISLGAIEYYGGIRVPLGVVIFDAMLTLILCGGLRILPRLARERTAQDPALSWSRYLFSFVRREKEAGGRRILVVGAGDAGENLVREMIRKGQLGYAPVGFVDDNPAKKGLRIHGVKVRGGREDIPRLVAQQRVDEILIAIPSATADQIRPLVEICRGTGAKLKILPDLVSLVHGAPRLSDVRELRIEDLIGRPRIELNQDEVSAYLRGRRVMVTGAGGSIGSELCRQVLRYHPAEIQLLGRGENSIFSIFQELAPRKEETKLVELIGDVINKSKLHGLFTRHRPEIVFHAGADKHVPLMELNPDEAVLNNIVGTRNVCEVSNEFGVQRLVCISTDKAVNPSSIMGCCKRVAEMYIQSGRYQSTVVTGVRFGNVLGSRGSVIPLFQHQIERGGPVTVTHREVRRYFMSIPEAVALVIQAGAMAQGGEIFVLDMGEPIAIDELARRVIRLHGLEPDRDIPVVYVGLRPGEKLDEELVGVGERREPTVHNKISKVIRQNELDGRLDEMVARLTRQAVEMDDLGIRETLRLLVPEYQPYLPPEVQSWAARRPT